MDVDGLVRLVSTLGFPAFVAVYVLVRIERVLGDCSERLVRIEQKLEDAEHLR